jgi:hypothetical protein
VPGPDRLFGSHRKRGECLAPMRFGRSALTLGDVEPVSTYSEERISGCPCLLESNTCSHASGIVGAAPSLLATGLTMPRACAVRITRSSCTNDRGNRSVPGPQSQLHASLKGAIEGDQSWPLPSPCKAAQQGSTATSTPSLLWHQGPLPIRRLLETPRGRRLLCGPRRPILQWSTASSSVQTEGGMCLSGL